MDFQKSLASKLGGYFDSAIAEHREKYKSSPESFPGLEMLKDRLNHYIDVCIEDCNAIKGQVNDPDSIDLLIDIIESVSALILEIGCAHGKHEQLTRDSLLHVLLSAFSRAGCPELSLPDRIIINSIPDYALQQSVNKLASYFAQSLVKSVVVNWTPKIGHVLLIGWVKYIVTRMYNRANDFFAQTFEISPEKSAFFTEPQGQQSKDIVLEKMKIQLLMNLMKSDGEIAPEEYEYIELMLSNSILPEAERDELLSQANTLDQCIIDFKLLSSIAEDPILMMLDLYALAKRDGKIHEMEKKYLEEVGSKLGISERVMLYF